MGSLGPQLDSAIEAAIRMLEGNTGAGRHDSKILFDHHLGDADD